MPMVGAVEDNCSTLGLAGFRSSLGGGNASTIAIFDWILEMAYNPSGDADTDVGSGRSALTT